MSAGDRVPGHRHSSIFIARWFSASIGLLFSPKQRMKPGPKGPTADLIHAVVEMKRRNPSWGCPQIAGQINLAFGTANNSYQ